MTTFDDGPAQGKTLQLKRAPYFLRVTEEKGTFDALDQVTDTPRETEKIYAYVIVGEPGFIHINARRGGGGFFTYAHYRLVEQQPADSEMRKLQAWRDWCVKNAPPDFRK